MVIREQVVKLREAADALEAVEQLPADTATVGGTVGFARNVSEEELSELRKEDDDDG